MRDTTFMLENFTLEERALSKVAEMIFVTKVSIFTPEERSFPIASRFLKSAPRVFWCTDPRKKEVTPRVEGVNFVIMFLKMLYMFFSDVCIVLDA